MKEELRKAMRQQIGSISNPVYLPVGILEEYLPSHTRTLFAFLSHGHEIGTEPLIDNALARGITVAVPRVTGDDLAFYQISSSTGPFETGAFGIREPPRTANRLYPDDPDSKRVRLEFPLTIVIPALAFSPQGDRLGRGAGFYDRFLSRFLNEHRDKRSLITLVGACHSCQIVPTVPVESHDIPVDCLLTEKSCIVCV